MEVKDEAGYEAVTLTAAYMVRWLASCQKQYCDECPLAGNRNCRAVLGKIYESVMSRSPEGTKEQSEAFLADLRQV